MGFHTILCWHRQLDPFPSFTTTNSWYCTNVKSHSWGGLRAVSAMQHHSTGVYRDNAHVAYNNCWLALDLRSIRIMSMQGKVIFHTRHFLVKDTQDSFYWI